MPQKPDSTNNWKALVTGVKPLDMKPRATSDQPSVWQVRKQIENRLAQTIPDSELPFVPRQSFQTPLQAGQLVGLDKSKATRLKKGLLPIEGRLDLHGLTRDQAEITIAHFIENAFASGKRTLLLITGKGLLKNTPQGGKAGVLKHKTPEWLNKPATRARILAFTYARPQDGGDGALYILLKKNKSLGHNLG